MVATLEKAYGKSGHRTPKKSNKRDKSDSSDFNSFIANLELPKLSVNERDKN